MNLHNQTRTKWRNNAFQNKMGNEKLYVTIRHGLWSNLCGGNQNHGVLNNFCHCCFSRSWFRTNKRQNGFFIWIDRSIYLRGTPHWICGILTFYTPHPHLLRFRRTRRFNPTYVYILKLTRPTDVTYTATHRETPRHTATDIKTDATRPHCEITNFRGSSPLPQSSAEI